MSAQHGDKSRHGRLRKKKIADRARNRELRKSLVKPVPVPPAAA